MKTEKVLVVIFFLCFSQISFSQDLQETKGKEKQVYHTIDLEPFALGYTISQSITEKWQFGIGFQLGASFRYFINNPIYKSKKLKPSTKFIVEIMQFKIFYRYLVSSKSYVNIGGYWGFGLLDGNIDQKVHSSLGAIGDFFWGSKHFKIGGRLQIGNTHISSNVDNKINLFSILVTPIVLQINF